MYFCGIRVNFCQSPIYKILMMHHRKADNVFNTCEILAYYTNGDHIENGTDGFRNP